MGKKIRFFDEHGNVGYAENPLVIPVDVLGEDGFRVLHSGVTITPQSTTQYIKPRFFSEEVADQLVENEIKRKQADEKVKQMLSGEEYAKLGGLALGGAAAAGGAAYTLPAISAYIAPTTIGGNIVGDMAGGLALGTAMEEGQRAAFGQSAGDILYKQVKPYLGDSAVGDFVANMARPEYFVSPSMLFKGTYNVAQNTLGKQFENTTMYPKTNGKVLNQESTHDIIEGAKIINGNANIDKLQKAGLFNPSENTLYVKHVASPNLYKVIGSTDKYYDDVIYDIFDRVEKQAPKDFLTNLQINQAVKDVVNNKTYYINDLENPLNGWFVPANNFGKGKSIINVSAPIGDEELLGALIHERYMHPTERIVERLKLHKPYEDFLEEIGLNKELWNEFRAELGHLKYVNQPEVNASLEELLKHFYPSSSGANVFKDAINNTIKNNPELKSAITNKLKSLITTGPAIIPVVVDNKESKYQEGGQIIAPTDAISSQLQLTPIGGLVPYEEFAPKIQAKQKPRYRYNRRSPQFLIPTEDYSIKLDDRELEYNNGSWFEVKSGNRKYIMYPRDYLFYDPNKKARFILDPSGRVIINQPAIPVKEVVSDNTNQYNLPKLHNANTSRRK